MVKFVRYQERNYCNNNSEDGLHPYHKAFDNFRRTTGSSVDKVRELVNLINN
jgi:hypothetical protein